MKPSASTAGHLFRFAHPSCEWVRIATVSVVNRKGQLQGQSLRLRDVTSDERNRQALAASEARYRNVIMNASEAIGTLNPEGYLIEVNPAWTRITGYTREDLATRPVRDLVLPEHQDQLTDGGRKLVHGETIPVMQYGLRCKDGSTRYISASFRPEMQEGRLVRIEVIARDITEQRHTEETERRMQARLQEAQRLESLGMLAGGVAHDFNNLLMGILGHAELALDATDTGTTDRRHLHQIREAAIKAAALTSQMLAYSGKSQVAAEPTDLARIVRRMHYLLHTLVPPTARLEFAISPVPMVIGDVAQVHHIVTALCSNAGEALGDTPGTITVRTGTCELAPEDIEQLVAAADLTPGPFVYLDVSDTGPGMDAHTMSRIFDPFFSTKFTGRGLGLAAVHGIARAHNGGLRVVSAPGEGATFTVYFPIVAMKPVAEPSATAADAQWTGTGTVLVVDDEETMREVASAFLVRVGFKVLTARNGREGVDRFIAHASEISAILLDLTMPNMMGDEAYRELRRIHPHIPIVIMSGYTANEVPDELKEDAHAAFLAKPFDSEALASILRRLMAA